MPRPRSSAGRRALSSCRGAEQDRAGGRRGRRPGGGDHQPGQGLLPGGRDHQARRGPLLPRGRRGCAARGGRAAERARALRGRDPRRVLLPEARPRLAAAVDRGRAVALPFGPRGIHVNVRLHRRWSFAEVRRAALALAREVERRAPALATSKWWKEERHGVFLDYNQNAKDRTVASAYSVRPNGEARVSAPVSWAELEQCDPRDFTLRSMPARFADVGD